MKSNPNEETLVQLGFRIPEPLKAKLEELAAQENRTVSGQIRHLIEQATTARPSSR